MEMETEEAPSLPDPQQNYPQPPKDPPILRKPLPKSKKKPLSKKKLAIINQKLSLLSRNLRLFPSSSSQTLDSFSPHEPLFRSLNLWDFITLDLDSSIRSDLLADLIAHYDPVKHHSLVRGLRLNLSRADLGRALHLPKPSSSSAASEFDAALFGGADEVATVLCRFISTRIVFLEDAAILPAEVVTANRLVREGKPDRVDWAGMMWALVEKDILGATESGSCYYASHIQCLMKYQKPKLFETEVEISEAATVEEDGDGEEFGDVGSEKCEPGLSLGVGEDVEESKKEEDGCLEGDELSKGEENKGKMVVDDGLDEEIAAAKFATLERLTSSDFMQVMGTGSNLSFGLEQSNGEFLGMGSDMHNKGMGLDLGSGGSFLFGNEGKRPIDEDDDHINQQKRFRSDQPWEETPTVIEFDGCMEKLHILLGKARMNILQKEQACMNAQIQMQYLNGVMQQKDEIIQSLEKTRMEEQQKRDVEATRFDHDLRTLSHVLFGCKKALKDTEIAFAEYRKKFPLVYEPLRECDRIDDDALGDIGLRKACSTKEEEMRQNARTMINDFYKSWSDKLNKYATWVSESATKLVKVRDELKLLKERMANGKDQSHG